MPENSTLVITVAQYNFGYSIPFVLLDADGTAYNVSALTTFTFIVWKYRDVGDVVLVGTIVIDDATLGTCHYVVAEHDFDVAASYQCIIEGTDGGSTRITWGPATLNVQAVPHT